MGTLSHSIVRVSHRHLEKSILSHIRFEEVFSLKTEETLENSPKLPNHRGLRSTLPRQVFFTFFRCVRKKTGNFFVTGIVFNGYNL